jgi:hypothetical protein
MRKFDSNEEMYFSRYLNELKGKKYIDSWKTINEPYNLTTGIKHEYVKPMKKVDDKVLEQTILSPSVYTPDFMIVWNSKANNIFVQKINKGNKKITTPFICDDEGISIVETKGQFDRSNMTRLAINNIKFLYEKYNIYVNLIKVPGIFKKTFTPDRYLMTDKTFKPRKLNYKPKTIREYVNNNK